MTMQRRHFELIANTIRDLDIPWRERAKVTTAFCNALSSTNPQFNRERFIMACEPDGITGED